MVFHIAPDLPHRRDWRIGAIGAGFIMSECHLPAYRKAGLQVVAMAGSSNHSNRARETAQRHGIQQVYPNAEALLDDPTIEVLDLAVPPAAQVPLIRAACARGTLRGILAQKPLGIHYGEAREAVEACAAAGILLAVNQNMRYDPSVRAASELLTAGRLGDPILATIDMRAIPHWMPWQRDLGWVTLRIMSIHHLDCFRYWFGDPERIFCSVRTDPRTPFPHQDGIAAYILEYASGLRCVGLDDTWTGPAREGCPADLRISWRVEGTEGLAIGDIGWCKDPYTSPSTLRWAARGDQDFHQPQWSESWFPDAFLGTMAQLLVALETGQAPAISGHDNLRTMALVEAAYRSVAERRAVAPSEITGSADPESPTESRESAGAVADPL